MLFLLFSIALLPDRIAPLTTNTALIKAESLMAFYEGNFLKPEIIKPSRGDLFKDGRFLVIGFEPENKREVEEFVKRYNGEIVKSSQTEGHYLLSYFPDFDIEENNFILNLKESTNFIRYIEPSLKMKKCFIPNDQFFLSYQWDKWVMYADYAWDVTLGSKGIKIAVCDQGIDYYHPDLRENFNFEELGYDFVDNDLDPYPDASYESHGTHVAGIIAGITNNGVGIAGWCQVTLLSVRVLNEEGTGSDFDVAEGIRWATNHGARIINLSLGASVYSKVLAEAVDYAWRNGALVVAASGNEGSSSVYYPAGFDEVIAVGALDTNNRIAGFSNYGRQQELVCPGVSILSTVNDGNYEIFNGTSMACPQVSGVAGLILSYNPTFSNKKVRVILNLATIDLGAAGRDRYYGFGLLNAHLALLIAKEIKEKTPTAKSKIESLIKNEMIFDIQGRRIDKIRNKGIYFTYKEGQSKKIIFNLK